jgi:hypothetical protein
MNTYGHISPQFLNDEINKLSFQPKEETAIEPLRKVAALNTLSAPKTAQADEHTTLPTGHQNKLVKHFKEVGMERAKRFELSTLSLGS